MKFTDVSWRGRMGRFRNLKFKSSSILLISKSMIYCILIIQILLLISGIEINPGPPQQIQVRVANGYFPILHNIKFIYNSCRWRILQIFHTTWFLTPSSIVNQNRTIPFTNRLSGLNWLYSLLQEMTLTFGNFFTILRNAFRLKMRYICIYT